MPRAVKCPHCGRAVTFGPQSPYRPFCSERCKLTDLGAWASDSYRISGRADETGENEGAPPAAPPRSPRA